ncbi:MEDS domain-containing protein [Cryptosporangium sp. NPDC048952]|uniref:MEDS domain-containing protein n=1 Tax=Cryptosporangium sp. NPDC048952 TaxID=3363961 RepID=UPI0037214E1B
MTTSASSTAARKSATGVLGEHGNLEVAEPENGHLQIGRNSPDALFARLNDWVGRNMISAAAPFGRLVGDMSWAGRLMSPTPLPELVGEEIAVTSWLRQYPQVVLCLYDLELFGGDLIIPMVKAHPKVWMAGSLIENPYYLRSSENGFRH